MPGAARWPWILVAATSVVGLALLATNRGFYHTDELDLLRDLGGGVWCNWRWFTNGSELFYRPLGVVALRTQLGITGGSAILAHTLSVLHHVGNFGLFALLLGRLGLPRRVALLALLPTTVPGIGWVAATYDRLALTWLCLAALLLLARGARCLLAVPLFLVALTTKETAVAFAVPALLLALRPERDRRWRCAAAGLVAVAAAAFALWRQQHGSSVPEYTLRADPAAVVRLLRYGAFPFALGTGDPSAVWGTRWLGAVGGMMLGAIALHGSWRMTLAGLSCAAAPLLPIVILPKVEGHYLYLATPGLLLVVAAALRCTLRGAHLVLATLLVVSFVHSFGIVDYYRRFGGALHDLGEAHERLGGTGASLDVHGEPWLGEAVAALFARHAERHGLRPPVRLLTAPAAGAWTVSADGEVRQQP